MSGTESNNVAVCRAWYAAFHRRRLDQVMELFIAHPRVVIGAGGSVHCAPYAGTYDGPEEVRGYYERRFGHMTKAEQAATDPVDPNRPMRTRCGLVKDPCEFGPWVIFSGDIKDEPEESPYEGPFLHVFRFAPNETKIACLEMFLVPDDYKRDTPSP